MAWQGATPFAKLTVNALNDSTAKTWNETLGYTKANAFSSDTVEGGKVKALKNFSQGVISNLTNGVYQKSNLTYEINLDELEYDS